MKKKFKKDEVEITITKDYFDKFNVDKLIISYPNQTKVKIKNIYK